MISATRALLRAMAMALPCEAVRSATVESDNKPTTMSVRSTIRASVMIKAKPRGFTGLLFFGNENGRMGLLTFIRMLCEYSLTIIPVIATQKIQRVSENSGHFSKSKTLLGQRTLWGGCVKLRVAFAGWLMTISLFHSGISNSTGLAGGALSKNLPPPAHCTCAGHRAF